ncbi:MAG: hypothetical protein QW083_00670 [Methanomassiliicoccales archaeon]
MNQKKIKSIKRLTRAGSGGYSVYLPKKWIRNWNDDHEMPKEIKMFNVGDYLILAPHSIRRRIEVNVDNMGSRELREFILSSYINGADDFVLQSSFLSDASIGESLSIIRALDENLVHFSSETGNSYSTRTSFSHETGVLMRLLFEKINEAGLLLSDLLRNFDINPEKGLHILRLLYSLEEEDIDRIAFQIMRNASKFDIELETTTEINLLWALADNLEKIGDTFYSIIGLVCDFFGLEIEELRYPVEYIQQHIESKNFALSESVKHLKESMFEHIRHFQFSLGHIRDAMLAKDGKAALKCADALTRYISQAEREYWENLAEIIKPMAVHERMSFIFCNELALRIWTLLSLLEGMAKRIALVYFSYK